MLCFLHQIFTNIDNIISINNIIKENQGKL